MQHGGDGGEKLPADEFNWVAVDLFELEGPVEVIDHLDHFLEGEVQLRGCNLLEGVKGLGAIIGSRQKRVKEVQKVFVLLYLQRFSEFVLFLQQRVVVDPGNPEALQVSQLCFWR